MCLPGRPGKEAEKESGGVGIIIEKAKTEEGKITVVMGHTLSGSIENLQAVLDEHGDMPLSFARCENCHLLAEPEDPCKPVWSYGMGHCEAKDADCLADFRKEKV